MPAMEASRGCGRNELQTVRARCLRTFGAYRPPAAKCDPKDCDSDDNDDDNFHGASPIFHFALSSSVPDLGAPADAAPHAAFRFWSTLPRCHTLYVPLPKLSNCSMPMVQITPPV